MPMSPSHGGLVIIYLHYCESSNVVLSVIVKACEDEDFKSDGHDFKTHALVTYHQLLTTYLLW